MVELALKFEAELTQKLRDTWMVEKYKYFHINNYLEDIDIPTSTYNRHDFVSVTEVDGKKEVIGYIVYCICRETNDVSGLAVINFGEPVNAVFAHDLYTVISDIFEKYRFRRLEWTVLVGNPVEDSYDKLCKKYGGRIVGTYRQKYKLYDGMYYDQKVYELFREDYLKNKRNAK